MNRVNSPKFPDSVCGVVQQGGENRHRCQFSWYCDGKGDDPKNQDAYIKARDIAYSILVHEKYKGLTEGATHYHADYVNPKWSKDFTIVGTIGAHIFYRAD